MPKPTAHTMPQPADTADPKPLPSAPVPAKPSPYPPWQRATTGRPTTYNPAYCNIIDAMGSDGSATLYHIAARLDTTHITIQEWMRDYKEFGTAVARARDRMAAFWIQAYTSRALEDGKGIAQQVAQFHLKNITDWQDARVLHMDGQVVHKSAASQAYAKHIKHLRDDAIDAEYTVLDDGKVTQ